MTIMGELVSLKNKCRFSFHFHVRSTCTITLHTQYWSGVWFLWFTPALVVTCSSSANLICSGESAFLLHCCTDVFLSTALLYRCTSKPAVPSHIQRSTNGNNEPFQWNYQRSIINYCLARRGGSMEHAGCYNVLAANHQLLKTCWLLLS